MTRIVIPESVKARAEAERREKERALRRSNVKAFGCGRMCELTEFLTKLDEANGTLVAVFVDNHLIGGREYRAVYLAEGELSVEVVT